MLDTALASWLVGSFMAAYLAASALESGFVAWSNARLLGASSPGRAPDNDERAGMRTSADALRALRRISFAASMVTAVATAVSVAGVSWYWMTLASALALGTLAVLGGAGRALAGPVAGMLDRRGRGVVDVIAVAFTPYLAAEEAVARAISASFGAGEGEAGDLRYAAGGAVGFGGELLDEREVRMIRAVVRQDKTVAREIMVPRVDITAVEVSVPISAVAARMIESGHSKLPVYRETLDRIEGFVYSMDLIRVIGADGGTDASLSDLARPALLIPESRTLEGLLRQFQEKRVQMAVVVDEYGGVSGLVTVEDLLEEIVGEIEDEFDVDGPQVVDLTGAGADAPLDMIMDARIGVDQVAELTGVEMRGEGFDTLGGFVLDRLGRIPSRGDAVDYDGVSIRVVSTSGRRLGRLRVTRTPPPA